MRVIIFLYFAFLLTCSNAWSQTGNEMKNYSSLRGNYQIILPFKYSIVTDTIPNGYQDKFNIYNDKGAVRYLINIVFVKGYDDHRGSVFGETYKQNYLNTCSCEITKTETIHLKNLTDGVAYYYKFSNTDKSFLGVFNSILIDKTLYTFTYNTIEKIFSMFFD